VLLEHVDEIDDQWLLTQLLLKQSCEQKKLSLPIFRQLGHCKVPASFWQSTPMHLRFTAPSVVMLRLVG
jgi:hypothetical protein